MADKKQEFVYGASAVPSGERKYEVIRWGWGGLNKADDIDTGQLSDASGIIVDPPNLNAWHYARGAFNEYADKLIGIFGFDDRLVIIYRDSSKIKADVARITGLNAQGGMVWSVTKYTLGDALGTNEDFKTRSVVQFNAVTIPPGEEGNVAAYTYDRRLLIFPDCWSIPYHTGGSAAAGNFNTGGNTVPPIKYASVYLSRVFGVGENSVYASHYNNYADWTLDTADNVSSDNAWMSMSQSNTNAIGEFTAIATYDNHVVLFKPDFMQLVYNNKNPFRIVDVGAYGCDNPYAVAEMGGVLYFASQDKLYGFAGGTPKDVGKTLDIKSYKGAVLGSFRNTLYLYVGGALYTLQSGVWSKIGPIQGRSRTFDVVQFATLDYGIYARLDDDEIVLIDWAGELMLDTFGGEIPVEYLSDWWFETDLMALGSLDVRRVKKFSLWCEGKKDTEIRVYLLRDSEKFDADTAEEIGSLAFDEDGVKIMRILTRQFSAHAHRLRFAGSGYIKLYAAELKISWGGDVYVEGS